MLLQKLKTDTMRTESGIRHVHRNNHCKAKHLRDVRTYMILFDNVCLMSTFVSTTVRDRNNRGENGKLLDSNELPSLSEL